MGQVALFITGSHAQRLETPTSDFDTMSVFVAPEDAYLGLSTRKLSNQRKSENSDLLEYEFLSYAEQLWKGNSTFFNTLWYYPVYESGEFYTFRNAAREVLTTQKPLRNYLGLANRRFETAKEKHNEKDLAAACTYYFMVREYCEGGVMNVNRENGESFYTERAVKQRFYEWDEAVKVVKLAERVASEAYAACTLPLEPDFDAYNSFVVAFMRNALKYGL
jgi:predicted nucleotidyltransferase